MHVIHFTKVNLQYWPKKSSRFYILVEYKNVNIFLASTVHCSSVGTSDSSLDFSNPFSSDNVWHTVCNKILWLIWSHPKAYDVTS